MQGVLFQFLGLPASDAAAVAASQLAKRTTPVSNTLYKAEPFAQVVVIFVTALLAGFLKKYLLSPLMIFKPGKDWLPKRLVNRNPFLDFRNFDKVQSSRFSLMPCYINSGGCTLKPYDKKS